MTYLEREHNTLLGTFNLLTQMIQVTSHCEEIIIITKPLGLSRILVMLRLYVTAFINISLCSVPVH